MNTNAEIFRAVLLTAFLCAAAGFILLHLQGRRHERDMAPYRMTGIPPHWHPEALRDLTAWERDELDGIAARWDNAGLAIFDGEGDGT